ncbi:hypothetical protein CEXT_369051 [Caerostris extrusa]|uniref:Uncharacterized protein n=1 Tax=Caerostris extrusa TaxID=172846 RepID=A0AAV4YDY5_CAEEX|nr:hypothetical protein CEXT_369051 [Caerostris extrusa]
MLFFLKLLAGYRFYKSSKLVFCLNGSQSDSCQFLFFFCSAPPGYFGTHPLPLLPPPNPVTPHARLLSNVRLFQVKQFAEKRRMDLQYASLPYFRKRVLQGSLWKTAIAAARLYRWCSHFVITEHNNSNISNIY